MLFVVFSQMRHPHVVLFMGACTETGHMCMVSEFMPNGSVYDIIRKNSQLSLYRKVRMAKDVAQGMTWLHGAVRPSSNPNKPNSFIRLTILFLCFFEQKKPQIIHRDLKPQNLLVTFLSFSFSFHFGDKFSDCNSFSNRLMNTGT
jgi:serine/threonine protein kinase